VSPVLSMVGKVASVEHPGKVSVSSVQTNLPL
jgi:hypothetical protein